MKQPTDNAVMYRGREHASAVIEDMASAARESGNPAGYWLGILHVVAGGMYAQCGYAATVNGLRRVVRTCIAAFVKTSMVARDTDRLASGHPETLN